MLFHTPTRKNWTATSALGTFVIRGGTTDFQFINYTYEKQIKEHLKKEALAGNMDTFIDVGACIGEYCVWLAKQQVRCIAFEPVNYAATRENIVLNNVADKVKLYECGLGSKAEKVNFNIMATVTGSSHIDRDGGAGNIPLARFDELFPDLGISYDDKVIIKLDVEGMEPEVLEGMRGYLTKARHLQVIFERFDEDESIHNKLNEMGQFRFEPLDQHNILAVKINS
jgi:FkbM family methyltransferase